MFRFNFKKRLSKVQQEYIQISNEVTFKFSILNLILVTIAAFIIAVINFVSHEIINGIILLLLALTLAGAIYCRNKCKRIIPALSFVVAQTIMAWGLAVTNNFIGDIGQKSVFYTGYSFALFQSVLAQFFPTFWIQILFIMVSIGVRYLFMIPDKISTVFAITIFDIAAILILYHNEKNKKSLFQSFYEYREGLSKFKTVLAYHLPENIVILSKDLDKTFFINEYFEKDFKAKTLEEIFTVFTELNIDMSTLDQKCFSGSQVIPMIQCAISNLNLYEFLKRHKDTITNRQQIICFNAINNDLVKETRSIYGVKIFHLNWDKADALMIILHDLTQQETILALKVADENKDMLLATVSHELRTPINGMLGITQIIEHEFTDPKLLSYCKTAKICSTLLLNLVNSILDLTQIRKNCIKLNPDRFKLSEMLDEIESIFRPQCLTKNLDFEVNVDEKVPREISTDRGRLTQIIVNLLANALKFTFKGKITIDITPSPLPDEINICIRDTGIGIKKEDQQRLFKLFGKLDTNNSRINTQGVGLGLTISNSLVSVLNPNKDNVHINLKSEFGEGSVFSFSIFTKLNDIPITINTSGHADQPDQKDVLNDANESLICNHSVSEYNSNDETLENKAKTLIPLSSLLRSNCQKLRRSTFQPKVKDSTISVSANEKSCLFEESNQNISLKDYTSSVEREYIRKLIPVLVVDDNTFNIMIVSNLLTKNGFLVTSAFNGKDCIQKIKEQDKSNFFRIVLMDCQMPVMDGFEATRVLKSMMISREIPEIPVVALTANDTKQDKEKCTEAGMSGHLTKPLKEADLQKVINKFIKI